MFGEWSEDDSGGGFVKINMVCQKCGYSVEWYSMYWHEVMGFKSRSGKYLCGECVDGISLEAVLKYMGNPNAHQNE